MNAPYTVAPLSGLTSALAAHGVDVVHTPSVYGPGQVMVVKKEQLTEPVAGKSGARVRFLGASGDEVYSEVRTDGPLLYIGAPQLADTYAVEVTCRCLPARDELVRAVVAANSNTAVVINSGAPVLTACTDGARALLVSWRHRLPRLAALRGSTGSLVRRGTGLHHVALHRSLRGRADPRRGGQRR
ncbi:hypothetical protein GCM10010094_40870 [Streptomyces flaveus]|uniref:Uncharacterized protein n=1 Tax=Streptomyces flaveus TaxID=66370 RepID=A0A917VFN6_9ACTN|nr:hypothetical protein GCM10010094_40870 [Streptomyces flaveus]